MISTEALKADSKSIAVTDIYFKREGKNLTFIKETRTVTDKSISSTITPKTIEVDADKTDASVLTVAARTLLHFQSSSLTWLNLRQLILRLLSLQHLLLIQPLQATAHLLPIHSA